MNAQLSASAVRSLALDALQFSKTPIQAERRAHFDKDKLTDLVASIKAHGIVQPILVRPHNGGDSFEVVAGERRVTAARKAGLTEIMASVRELTDEQVYELQLVENLQRQDLHELAEAEGYEALLKLGHSVDDMAAKVGKSKATIYARMKLLALDPASRQAMYRGELSASIALLIARIPVASVQREACAAVTKPKYNRDGEPMSFRDARDHIERNYMLRLSDAPFPTGDAQLLPKAGACGACPKRTGNQPELFGDIKGADVCTDPVCFKLKRKAWSRQQIEAAKAAGRKVITGAEAKRVAPYNGTSSLQEGYVGLDNRCFDDPKNRTYRQIIGKGVKTDLLQDKDGDVHEIVQKSAITKVLKEKGAVRASVNSPSSSADKAARTKRVNEKAFETAAFAAIFRAAPKALDRADLESLAIELFGGSYGNDEAYLFEAFHWAAPNGKDYRRFEKAFEKHIPDLSSQELNGVILVLLARNHGSIERPKAIDAIAKRLKIDVAALRKISAKPVEKPAPKKKASRAAKVSKKK